MGHIQNDNGSYKSSFRNSFRALIGLDDHKPWSIWFFIATTLGLVANFVILLGCMSTSTQSIHTTHLSSNLLINVTSSLTNVSAKDLDAQGLLPRHWYWGLSGICAIYNDNNHVVCKRAFPPTNFLSTKNIVAFGLTSNPTIQSEKQLTSLMSPWIQALSELRKQDHLLGNTNTSQATRTNLQAGAALCILSTLLAFGILVLAVLSMSTLRQKLPRWKLYILALVDTLLFFGAGWLTLKGLEEGPRAIARASSGIDQGSVRSFAGPGSYVVMAGVLFKAISIALLCVVVFFAVLLMITLIMLCLSCCKDEGRDQSDLVYVYEHPVRD